MEVAKAFGLVIKKWRFSRDMTQENLAIRSGLDRTFISLLERGERQPSLQTIFLLGRALKVSANELVRQTENKAQFSGPHERRVFVASKRL